MKKALTVALPGREYQIEIQRGLLDQAGERCRALLPRARKLAVVTDSHVLPLYLERTADSLKRAGFQVRCCSVPAGEAAKRPEQLVLLWEKMMDFGMTRTDGVVALGGGVVGDLAGFAAATLLRGVDLIQRRTVSGTDRDFGIKAPGFRRCGLRTLDRAFGRHGFRTPGQGFGDRCGSRLQGRTLGQCADPGPKCENPSG